jgi:4'-phosphopantetheinyl transferase
MATIVAEHIAQARPPLRLEAREIHVWSIPIDIGDDAMPELVALLSSSEQQRAERYIIDSARRRFVAARASLRLLVGRYLDLPAGMVQFTYGPSGKPYLIGPYAGQLHFSLSHSHRLAQFAFCAEEELGIDLEWRHDIKSMDQIVRRMFSPEEIADWFSLPESQRRRGFFDCWTRKEAFVKALGRGLEVPLDTFPVAFRPGEIPAVRWRKDRLHEQWSMFDVSPENDYSAALAIRGRRWRITPMADGV